MLTALAGVFVGVTGGVPAVLVATLVGYGDGVPFGGCGGVGVGAEGDVGAGVGAQR